MSTDVKKATKLVEPKRVATPKNKKLAPGRIYYNTYLGNYVCVSNKTNKRVLTCNTLAGAIREFPDFEIIDPKK